MATYEVQGQAQPRLLGQSLCLSGHWAAGFCTDSPWVSSRALESGPSPGRVKVGSRLGASCLLLSALAGSGQASQSHQSLVSTVL